MVRRDPMRRWVKRAALVSASLALAVAAILWLAARPLDAGPGAPDPAVTYLNGADRMAGALSEGYFDRAGPTLHYVTAGSGETIVFLHGFPSNWFSFARQIEAISPRYRVIAIDGLGAGRSAAPGNLQAYQLGTMSRQLIALLDHLGAERVHLVGHDWGAAFAFGLAQAYPQRVLSVTGIAAPPQNVLLEALAEDPVVRQQASYIERLKAANLALVALSAPRERAWKGAYEPLVKTGALSAVEGQLFRQAVRDPRRINAHINWYRANIPAPDEISAGSFWPSRGARLSMPALFIWGSQDRVFNPAYAQRTSRLSADLRRLEIPGAGHWPHVERPDLVTRAIQDLIDEANTQRKTGGGVKP